jgi:hypothetical protein
MMTNEQILEFYNKLLDHYGKLPDPVHEPLQFAYLVKLYRHTLERKNE